MYYCFVFLVCNNSQLDWSYKLNSEINSIEIPYDLIDINVEILLYLFIIFTALFE